MLRVSQAPGAFSFIERSFARWEGRRPQQSGRRDVRRRWDEKPCNDGSDEQDEGDVGNGAPDGEFFSDFGTPVPWGRAFDIK